MLVMLVMNSSIVECPSELCIRQHSSLLGCNFSRVLSFMIAFADLCR